MNTRLHRHRRPPRRAELPLQWRVVYWLTMAQRPLSREQLCQQLSIAPETNHPDYHHLHFTLVDLVQRGCVDQHDDTFSLNAAWVEQINQNLLWFAQAWMNSMVLPPMPGEVN